MLTQKEAEQAVSDNIGSLESLCKKGICTADTNLLIALGFPERTSFSICEVISSAATEFGIANLKKYFEECLKEKRSTIINMIIRRKHKLYFATRSNLPPVKLLTHLRKDRADLCEALYEISSYNTNKAKRIRRYKNLANAVVRVRDRVRKETRLERLHAVVSLPLASKKRAFCV